MIAVLIFLWVFQENLLILVFHQYLQHALKHRGKETLVCLLIFIDGLIHKFLKSFSCFWQNFEYICLGDFDHLAKIVSCQLLRSCLQQPFNWCVHEIVNKKHLQIVYNDNIRLHFRFESFQDITKRFPPHLSVVLKLVQDYTFTINLKLFPTKVQQEWAILVVDHLWVSYCRKTHTAVSNPKDMSVKNIFFGCRVWDKLLFIVACRFFNTTVGKDMTIDKCYWPLC